MVNLVKEKKKVKMCLSDWRNIGEFEQFKILNTPFKNQ